MFIGTFLGVVAGGYLALVGGTALFQRAMIYHPGTSAGEPADAGLPEMTPVPVRSADGWVVTGWYAPPRQAGRPTVVFFHGNTGTIAGRAAKARAFLDAGYGLYMAEYRGFGGNPGQPTEQGLYADARAVLLWLTSRGVPESRIALYGESLGCAVAVQMAVERHVAALVLEAPFTRLADLAPPFVVPPLAELLLMDRFDNIAKIGKIQAPLLIIHGDADPTCPVAMGHALLKAADTDKDGAFFPGADHNNLWSGHDAGDKVLAFLAKWARA